MTMEYVIPLSPGEVWLGREEMYFSSAAGLKGVVEGAGPGGRERREERREWYRVRMVEAAGSCHRLSGRPRPW